MLSIMVLMNRGLLFAKTEDNKGKNIKACLKWLKKEEHGEERVGPDLITKHKNGHFYFVDFSVKLVVVASHTSLLFIYSLPEI